MRPPSRARILGPYPSLRFGLRPSTGWPAGQDFEKARTRSVRATRSARRGDVVDTPQLLVTLGGAALVAFILWFFFGARTAAAAHAGSGGVAEVDVDVRSSYVPDRIEAA